MKRYKLLWMWVAILFCTLSFNACSDNKDNPSTSEFSKTTEGFFTAEINKLIDANYPDVVANGYAKLIIPKTMYKEGLFSFPTNAANDMKYMVDAGFKAYVNGGTVRDAILGKPSHDVDFSTNASIEQIVATVPNAKSFNAFRNIWVVKAYHDGDIETDIAPIFAIFPELAGKDVVFKVKLNSLTMPELPELDDEFAKDVSEFDTLEEYKASIRENLAKTRAERAEAAFKDAVMFHAAENITADIPEVMIEEKEEDILRNYAGQFGLRDRSVSLDEIKKMMGINDEIMEKSIRPAALSQVKTDLLLDAVMEAEELADTDEAFEAYVSKTAAEVGATAEQLKQYFGEDFMRHEFRKELATNLIVDSAVAKAE